MIPYGKQLIEDDDIQAVCDVLRSDFLTCGPQVAAFESALADYCGTRHAVAVSNGTTALHLAMLAAGIGPGDRVLTTPITFLASANCGEFVGATVDFVDIDPETLCLSFDALQAAWSDDVKAVVAVDFAGYPCVSKSMADFIHERGAVIIEDACHAIGGSREGHRVGGLPWVDMSTFSFHPVKTMTAGEGGAVLTRKPELHQALRHLRNHGMLRFEGGPEDPVQGLVDRTGESSGPDAPWLYAMNELGFNYRITDMQCALALSQLGKLDRFVERRAAITAAYDEGFKDSPCLTRPMAYTQPIPQGSPAWHLYVVQIDFDGMGVTRQQVVHHLRQLGLTTQVHYIPVHLQPYYHRRYGYGPGKCPNAESYYRHTLSLPLFPAMTDPEVAFVIETVNQALNHSETIIDG